MNFNIRKILNPKKTYLLSEKDIFEQRPQKKREDYSFYLSPEQRDNCIRVLKSFIFKNIKLVNTFDGDFHKISKNNFNSILLSENEILFAENFLNIKFIHYHKKSIIPFFDKNDIYLYIPFNSFVDIKDNRTPQYKAHQLLSRNY